MLSTAAQFVTEIYGDQICVAGRWFHAERVFGRPARDFAVGQPVPELAPAPGKAPVSSRPLSTADEFVGCSLYRGCSSNEMCDKKLAAFAQTMIEAGGWGSFPLITGYVETIDSAHVEQYEGLVREGREHVWLTEYGWSRAVTRVDIGMRYVHVDNGHHRIAAAAIASVHVGQILVPVADLYREEADSWAMTSRPRPRAF